MVGYTKNVYTPGFLTLYDTRELNFRSDGDVNAKRHRDRVAKQMRKQGWSVRVGTYHFRDMGYTVYGLQATRKKKGGVL